MKQIKIIVEQHEDGYVAYPLGVKGAVVGQGNTFEEALADVKSAIKFHVESFGDTVLQADPSTVRHSAVSAGRAGVRKVSNMAKHARRMVMAVGITWVILAAAVAPAGPIQEAKKSKPAAEKEGEVVALLAPDTGMMLLTKTDKAGTIDVRGTLVGKNGAPVAGKTVCFRVLDEKGRPGIIADLSGGQLNALQPKSGPQGTFTAKVPRFPSYDVFLCTGVAMTIKVVKELKTVRPEDNATRIDLGKLVVE